MSKKLTIFTPTYNRAYTLGKLYESLQRQSDTSFEWIVLDDASTDDTEELFARWMKEDNPFDITYRKLPHGGKHRAMNQAFLMATTDWFFTVDSDDYIADDAVEKIIKWTDEVKDQPHIAAVAGSRFNLATGRQITTPDYLIENGRFICKNYERERLQLEGDKAEVYRTEILRQHMFPEFDGEFFETEAVCWDSIAYDGYSICFFPDTIYYGQYLEDGLTKNDANGNIGFYKNYFGFLEYVKIELKCHGLSKSTIGLCIVMLQIKHKKKVSDSVIMERLEISEQEFKHIKREAFRYLVMRGINKLFVHSEVTYDS